MTSELDELRLEHEKNKLADESRLNSHLYDLKLKTERRKADLEMIAKKFDVIDKLYSHRLADARLSEDSEAVSTWLNIITRDKDDLLKTYGIVL